MNNNVEEKLAESLTSHTTDIIPYLGYLLQDFWELGSSPKQMSYLIKKHISNPDNLKFLDLACGKGAVSITLAQELKIRIKGIDLLPEFIEFAQKKAIEMNVADLCEFEILDANEAVKKEKNYDCTIFGAVGDILGNYRETLTALLTTIKDNGYLLIDDGYIIEEDDNSLLKFERKYLTLENWNNLFKELNLEVIECLQADDTDYDAEKEMKWITTRANELIKKNPDKKEMFEDYVKNQENEYNDLENDLVGATWLLRKK